MPSKKKIGDDLINHNKLRLYATFKGPFKMEPYLDLVQSRNKRAWLSRLRCSGHHLEIEQGWWNKTPIAERFCKICNSGEIGDEYHAVMICKTFNVIRACFLGKMNSILPGFNNLSKEKITEEYDDYIYNNRDSLEKNFYEANNLKLFLQ